MLHKITVILLFVFLISLGLFFNSVPTSSQEKEKDQKIQMMFYGHHDKKKVELEDEVLSKNFSEFLKKINCIFSDLPQEEGVYFYLDTIEVAVEISQEGNFTIPIGIGAGAGSSQSFTVTFQRITD